MFKIQTLNKISTEGLQRFPMDQYEIASEFSNPDAILVRSAKMHDMELATSLKAIARAGAGVNNIPVDVCTDKGIVVFNTPGANANAVKELVIAAMLLSSRNRWALMHELTGEDEPRLEDLLAKLADVDLVLVEGYKRDRHPKVEAHRAETRQTLIAPEDDSVRAIASDSGAVAEGRPTFDLNNTQAIADFIAVELGL